MKSMAANSGYVPLAKKKENRRKYAEGHYQIIKIKI